MRCSSTRSGAPRALLAVLLVLPVLLSMAGPATATGTAKAPASATPPAGDLPVVLPQVPCGDLVGMEFEVLPGETARLTAASVVAATAGTSEYCRVTGTIAPQHGFELRLPTTTWTQRYLQTGCGGFCGNVPEPQVNGMSGCPRFESGEFVVGYGNAGHGPVSPVRLTSVINATWATDRSLVEDWAYESEHQLSIAAEHVIDAFYGRAPRHKYFNGCSTGGQQALVLAQRYPHDFDGILAGAPANLRVQLHAFSLAWNIRANTAPDGSEILTADDLPVLHAGALAACDARDGLEDELITDPRRCSFDPGALLCTGGQTSGCLTEAEVTAARAIYSGARSEEGQSFYPGGMSVGSELAWAPWIVRAPGGTLRLSEAFARGYLQHLADLDPAVSWDLDRLRFDRRTYDRLTELAGLYNADDPDLREFRAAGGKLILWHGWNDPAIPPTGTTEYYRALLREFGGPGTRQFARLFLVPGMYHCAGGDGPSLVDFLTPLTDWVEEGVEPRRVVVTQRDSAGDVVRTRPVYPFPRVAVYDGTGSPDDATNFVDRPSLLRSGVRWIGSFPSDERLWCRVEAGRFVCSEDPRAAA
ncbi:MAG: tannase/feruloyl esterase family alpha/beta hydrolase [Actinomycetota bacterium]|nr:tannase/feruloyl esterase family alpha/beta hydrolase [Actinomycetota bacterium]